MIFICMRSQDKFENYEYSSISNGIIVSVDSFYAAELSNITTHNHVFIYKIRISNRSGDEIKLIAREWTIVQEGGLTEIVRGEGVIGKQPIIKSGEDFEYASQAILFASSGVMYGKFFCLNLQTWQNLTIEVPAFSLDKTIKLASS
ncbi:MAG: Co2+/Mg2+ efflux protein ApaG [Alphaproteobacteria bacterium]|nr:Co2+/Mg2+ efflux protein ApaG [Alphaproteobacteria bacterium]